MHGSDEFLPNWINPQSVGLGTNELEELATRSIYDYKELKILREAGFKVYPADDPELRFIPPLRMRPESGVIVYDPDTMAHVLPDGFMQYRYVVEQEELTQDAVTEAIQTGEPMPFWLIWHTPSPVYGGEELLSRIQLPSVYEQSLWEDVDREQLTYASVGYICHGPHQILLAPWYMRGLNATSLMENPLRPMKEWLEDYPYLIRDLFGGAAIHTVDDILSPHVAQMRSEVEGSSAKPFWETLELPDGVELPPNNTNITTQTAATVVADLEKHEFFQEHHLHPYVDRISLIYEPARSILLWEDSQFSELVR